MIAHLEDVTEKCCDFPVLLSQLVLPQFHPLISGDRLEGFTIFDGEFQHVVSRFPACRNVAWHHPQAEHKFFEGCEPLG